MSITQLSGQALSPLFSIGSQATIIKSCKQIISEFEVYVENYKQASEMRNLVVQKLNVYH